MRHDARKSYLCERNAIVAVLRVARWWGYRATYYKCAECPWWYLTSRRASWQRELDRDAVAALPDRPQI